MNINPWTYWQLFNVLKQWFMSRWWDILANDDALLWYLNLALQDIYNSDSATWMHIYEILNGVVNWNFTKYETQFPIRKIQKCYPYLTNTECNYEENQSIVPSLFPIKNERQLRFSWKEILTHNRLNKIEIIYIKDFVPITTQDFEKNIEIPFRYIPALMKLCFDWAAPVNLMSWETQTFDFFSHYSNRNKELKDTDSVTDYLQVTPAY